MLVTEFYNITQLVETPLGERTAKWSLTCFLPGMHRHTVRACMYLCVGMHISLHTQEVSTLPGKYNHHPSPIAWQINPRLTPLCQYEDKLSKDVVSAWRAFHSLSNECLPDICFQDGKCRNAPHSNPLTNPVCTQIPALTDCLVTCPEGGCCPVH